MNSGPSSIFNKPTLKGIGLATLERIVNTALRLDPASREKLAALAGQIFHLECTQPELDVYLLPQSEGVQLAGHWEGAITAGLSGTRDDYLELLRSNDPATTLINGNLSVMGDSKALLRLRDIAAALELDWEAPLTRVFGDIAGHQMARSLRFGQRLMHDAFNSLRRQTRDYLQEENSWLARRWQFDQFKHDVAAADARAAQLVARAEQLRQTIAARLKRNP